MKTRSLFLALCLAMFVAGCGSKEEAAPEGGKTPEASTAGSAPAAGGDDKFAANVKPLLEKSCVKCHSGAGAKGGVDLAKLQTQADADGAKDVLAKAAAEVESKKMPPPMAPMSDEDRAALLTALKG